MKHIVFSLGCFLMLLASCAPDAKQADLVDEKGVVIENRGPVYLTSSCENQKTKEEMRKCADRILSDELKATAMDAVDPNDPPKLKKMIVSFEVGPNGKVADVKMTRAVGKGVDKAVVEFVSKTKWEPAIHDGSARKIIKQIPIVLN